jgi:hypothetical protein
VSPETGNQAGIETNWIGIIDMVTIKIAQAVVVARNPMFRQARGFRSLGRIPTAFIKQIETPRAAIANPNKRVTSGAANTQSQNPPLSDEEDRNIAEIANMSRARIFKAVSPKSQNGFLVYSIVTYVFIG